MKNIIKTFKKSSLYLAIKCANLYLDDYNTDKNVRRFLCFEFIILMISIFFVIK